MQRVKITVITFFLIMFVLCVVFSSCKTANITSSAGRSASVSSDVKHDSRAFVTIEEIPIMAWFGVQEHTIDRYHELKEAGINYNFTYYPNVEVLATAMDAANTAGVRMIIHCPELETETEKIVNRFINYPALAGYYLRDEPISNDFPHLGELARRIQAIDNNHYCYINLFPNYASPEQLGIPTYLEYVQSFLKEVPVQFLSFDHYPIRSYAGVRSLYSGWYENLEIISDEACKAGIPFWAFALTIAHHPYPIPTLADLRLQVYSNLAYGAQGIQYFTYWTTDPLVYNDCPIGSDGKKTDIWYKVQQMNREIKALSKVFLSAQVIKVEHIATNASGENADIPIATTRFDFANRPAEASIIKKFAIPNNTNALVSFLKNGNRAYMVIVNKNLEGGDNVTFTIKGSPGLQLIKKDGKAVSAFFQSSKQTVTPGDVLIYGWNVK